MALIKFVKKKSGLNELISFKLSSCFTARNMCVKWISAKRCKPQF